MKRIVSSFLLIAFLYISYGLYVSQWRARVYSAPQTKNSSAVFYDYAGAINVRTNLSSGSGLFEQVSKAANEAGLNFIIITDFNNFEIDTQRSAYSNNVLIVTGGEYSYLDARILNLDMRTTEHLQGPGRSQVMFSDLLSRADSNRDEGLFILSHPFKPGYQLKEPYPPGLNGLELINLKSVWQDTWLRSKPNFIWTALIYPFNSDLAFLRMLSRSGEREIELWDRLNKNQLSYGIFGSAAEARLRIYEENFIKFPSYETTLSIVRNHVLLRSELTGQPDDDRKKISHALRRGQFYMSLDLLQNPAGFYSYIRNGTNQLSLIGSEIKFESDLDLIVKLPDKPAIPFEVIVYKDGEKILTSNSADTSYRLQGPGVYRSVVRLHVPLPLPDGSTWMNWIITNPIHVK